jgi:hypothetical protein
VVVCADKGRLAEKINSAEESFMVPSIVHASSFKVTRRDVRFLLPGP